MCLCAVATLRAGPLGALYGTARATTIPRPSLSAQTRADLAWPGPEPGALVSLGTVTSESRPGGRPAPLRTQTARDPRCQWRTEARAARTHTATVTHTLAPTRRVRVTELGIGQPPGQSSRCFHLRQTNTGRADFKIQSFLSVGTNQQSRLKYSQSLMSIPFRLQS
jgi:hypothetical protein